MTNGIDYGEAAQLIDAAMAQCAESGVAMAVAVVDAGGHPVAMGRVDGASIIAAESVVQKARAAVWFGSPTARAVDTGREWPHVYLSFVIANDGHITLSKGGFPIRRDGVIIGGIGAAGGSGTQDEACSLAALATCGYAAE